jgi:hypothetical protein
MAVFNFRAVNYAQCTASVIADYWAVSAAHCLGPKSKVLYHGLRGLRITNCFPYSPAYMLRLNHKRA